MQVSREGSGSHSFQEIDKELCDLSQVMEMETVMGMISESEASVGHL